MDVVQGRHVRHYLRIVRVRVPEALGVSSRENMGCTYEAYSSTGVSPFEDLGNEEGKTR